MCKAQYEAVKIITEYCERVADNVLRMMTDHGLDRVNGMQMTINVDPALKYTTCAVAIGCKENMERGRSAGYCMLARGKEENGYVPTGTNSPEYEQLFADDALRARMLACRKDEKPLPPDGLWLSAYDDYPAVDDRGNVK